MSRTLKAAYHIATGYLLGAIVIAACYALLALSGCTDAVKATAPHSHLSKSDALTIARISTIGSPDSQIVDPSGQSMQPIVDHHAVLVADTAALFEAIEAGMMVMFDRNGTVYAHRAYERRDAGWIMLGQGNGKIDTDYCTPENYRDIIYGVFYHRGAHD